MSSLWDAVFSIAQSLSCLEVLSQAGERSYHVRIPWYKLHKTQLICISSKDIYLEIQNLFDKYLLSTYCMPGIIQGTGNACNRLSPCPQGACILIISGQEVLGWQRAGWGPWGSAGVWICSSSSTMSFRTRFFASCSAILHTLAFPYWACHLLVMRWPLITSSGSRSRRISTSRIFFSPLPVLTGGKPFPEDYTNFVSWAITVTWILLAAKESGKVRAKQMGPIKILS